MEVPELLSPEKARERFGQQMVLVQRIMDYFMDVGVPTEQMMEDEKYVLQIYTQLWERFSEHELLLLHAFFVWAGSIHDLLDIQLVKSLNAAIVMNVRQNAPAPHMPYSGDN